MAISARAQELADIRRAASGAARTLRQYQQAMRRLEARAVRAFQQGAHGVRKAFAARYAFLALYADRRGVLRRIRPHSYEWAKRKAVLKLDMRPGVARKGVLKTLQSPRVIVRTSRGFVFDLTAPDITVTGRATIGKSLRNLAGKRILAGKGKDRQVVGMGVRRKVTNQRSFRVNNYIDHFARQKAPGLGSLATIDKQRLRVVAREAITAELNKVQGAARARLGRTVKIRIRLDRVGG